MFNLGEQHLYDIIDTDLNHLEIQRDGMREAVGLIYRELRNLLVRRQAVSPVHTNIDNLLLWDNSLFPLLTEEERTVLLNLRGVQHNAHVLEQQYAAAYYDAVYAARPAEPEIVHDPVIQPDEELIRKIANSLDKGRKFLMPELKKCPKCCICLEKMKMYQVYCELPCGHSAFHHKCITQVLARQNLCPLCRREGVKKMTPVEIVQVAAEITARHNARTAKRRAKKAALEESKK